MPLRIYNTLTRKKEFFEPIESGKIGMYVCGPTVYDSCHIGHARASVVFDVITRYFREKGFDVTYVRNFTDVDDKIIKRATELGVQSNVIAEKYIKEFYEDMDFLNVERATIEPKATDHIEQIVKFIEGLISKNYAYQVDGDVYYSVETFKEYGKLSGRKLSEMEAGSRIEIDKRKRNPFDFALWKSAKPNEPFWNSPWGKGRPGWHVECSAMSAEYLGETFDIHGGGKDLIFPHHENEIAQSEAMFDKPFANFWIHNGFVNINKEKMSKSLGNFLMIKDVIKSYHPEAVRIFLLSNHYRSPIDFTDKALNEASGGIDKIYTALKRIQEKNELLDEIDNNERGEYLRRFCEAMDDDFNTALGISILFEAVRNVNRLLDENKILSEKIARTIKSEHSDILQIGNILGIIAKSPSAYFDERKSQALVKQSIDPKIIESMIQKRTKARKEKNWAKSDQIRKQLADMDVIIEDRPEGTVWKI